MDTGIRLRNKHLRKPDYFHVASYLKIQMTSQSFQRKDKGGFLGIFEIKIKGTENLVSVPFTFQEHGKQRILRGSFELNRKEYDLEGSSLILAKKVQVDIRVKVLNE